MRLLLLAAALLLQGCAAPVWVTAGSVSAVAGATAAAFTFDAEALKVWDEHHPVHQ